MLTNFIKLGRALSNDISFDQPDFIDPSINYNFI